MVMPIGGAESSISSNSAPESSKSSSINPGLEIAVLKEMMKITGLPPCATIKDGHDAIPEM